ncbi:hypothetical protein [Streptomyces sp. NBC_00582]|uniref:hypothetical protein n=1 Tax=Streptomyces sp. NBC_00582 TaxID=2975783 RepID=UPI002E7FDC6F|nr:hypothetical protein [Streptomyces sp. NBC_00582]WUB60191.1 hypothetical protein OG852_07205 [Streptomyces sp. NBC_00582]
MRVPVAALTACALSAVLLVAGRSGAEESRTPAETGVVLPATEDQGLSEEIGPESVPEIPDRPDGGGLVPDGPDESDTTELVDGVALN